MSKYWEQKTKFLDKFMHIVNFNYPTMVIQYIKMITMPEVKFIYQKARKLFIYRLYTLTIGQEF